MTRRSILSDVACVILGTLLAWSAIHVTPGNPPQAWRDAVARSVGHPVPTEIPGWDPIPKP